MRNDEERPTDAQDVVTAHGADADSGGVTAVDFGRLDPGSDVGGYVIDGVLGQGGMGTVYSATHPVIGKRAAIKVLRPEMSTNPAAVERFIMEARAVNQIGHPNIVDIFAFGTLPDGRSYYVMDLLLGESLRAKLKRLGPLHISEAASVIDEIASALIAAHDKGIIHRDLKPDNVFLASLTGRWPEVKLLDWGLLKLTSAQSSIANSRFRTLAGSVMGTPVYMSPEQARASDQVDFRTDIYALGVVSYELLAGAAPFKRDSSIDTMIAHQDEPVPPLAHKVPGLPEELVQLIEAMLAKEAQDRPTLAAVRAVIKRLRQTTIPSMTAAGLRIDAIPPPTTVVPERTSHPTLDERPKSDDNAATMPRIKMPAGVLPLPAPPVSGGYKVVPSDSTNSLPYQSMQVSVQKTLAGHSMPPVIQRAATADPAATPPMTYPQGSLPPQSQPATAATSRRAGLSRVLVILVAAIVVSGIGILLLLLQ